jgi:hypothetical protein
LLVAVWVYMHLNGCCWQWLQNVTPTAHMWRACCQISKHNILKKCNLVWHKFYINTLLLCILTTSNNLVWWFCVQRQYVEMSTPGNNTELEKRVLRITFGVNVEEVKSCFPGAFSTHRPRRAYCILAPTPSSRIHHQRRHASYGCARPLPAKAGTTPPTPNFASGS